MENNLKDGIKTMDGRGKRKNERREQTAGRFSDKHRQVGLPLIQREGLDSIAKKVFLTFLISCLSFGLLAAQDYWTTHILSVEKNQENLKKLSKMNLDLLMEWKNRIYIIAAFEDFAKLQEENVPYTLETFNFHPFKQTQRAIRGGVNGEYHSSRELEQDLFALEDSYPDLARLSIIGQSLEGRNIYALKISDNVHSDESEAEVIFIGCHHAREWISVEIPYLLAKYLVENYASDPQVQTLVNQSEIWIVPLLNPDGLEYSIHFYRYWRKNRRDNRDGTYGIDLNRNYGYQWGIDNIGSSPNTFSSTYRGPSAFSEPETQAIRDFFAQRNFSALISYHSFSQVILYPWGYTDQASPDDLLLEQMATDMSTRIQAVNGNDYGFMQAGEGFYLTNGDTTDWSYGAYGIPSFTIELPPVDRLQGEFFNAEEDIQTIFDENLPAMLYLIDWSVLNSSPPLDPPQILRRIPWKKIEKIRGILDGPADKDKKQALRIIERRFPKKKPLDDGTKSSPGQILSQKDLRKSQKEKKIFKE
jgi:murein tripeptide amidase MpaA